MFDFETRCPAKEFDCPSRAHLKELGITDPDAVSYGVAEMKFPPAPVMAEAMHRCVDDGFFGYGMVGEDYSRLVCDWMKQRHNWNVLPEAVVQTYGVVSAISLGIRAYSKPGDGVVIQTPVYNPFADEITRNGRRIVENPLIRGETGYTMDFAQLDAATAPNDVTVMVLCSPHNPVGRVWSEAELRTVSEICRKNRVFVLSDEIHHDLVYGAKHTVYAALSEEAAAHSLIATAPSKTFNIPGLVTSNIIIPDEAARNRFREQVADSIGHFLNVMGVAASTAAYRDGAPWVDALNDYLAENAACFARLVREEIPQAWTPHMEGTYLAWLDLGFLGMEDRELMEFVTKKAQIAANPGAMYGTGGQGFLRINIGCPRRYVEKAVHQIAEAVRTL